MSLEYSDFSRQETRTVSPCFCCEMKVNNFYVMANSSLFIVSCGLIIFALFMLFEFNIIFASLALLILASFHLIIALVSFLKYHRYETVGTRFHKWQAIGNIIFSMVMFLLYACGVVFLLVSTLTSDLKQTDNWSNLTYKYAILVGVFPVLVFYTYWSLLFMRIVSEKRQTYLSHTRSEKKNKSQSLGPSSEFEKSESPNRSI